MATRRDPVTLLTERLLGENKGSQLAILIATDPSLIHESTKDAVIAILDNLEASSSSEIAERKVQLCRRRNQEHSHIYKLPVEILIEILLFTVRWFAYSVNQLHELASVSKRWFDTVVGCSRFWTIFDADEVPAIRRMAMRRNDNGPLDIIFSWKPEYVKEAIEDLKEISPARWRSIQYYVHYRTASLFDYLHWDNSGLVDVHIFNEMGHSNLHLELSPNGSHLERVELWRMSLPWDSPRLSGLRWLFIEDLWENIPSIDDLHLILTSSPMLEHLGLIKIGPRDDDDDIDEPPRSIQQAPVSLPMLRTLQVNDVTRTIQGTLVPLLNAPSCLALVISAGDSDDRIPLDLHDTTLDLMAYPLATPSEMNIFVEMNQTTAMILLDSEPTIYDDLYCKEPSTLGVDVQFKIEGLRNIGKLWDGIIARSNHFKNNWKSVHFRWDGSIGAAQSEPILPWNLLTTCPNVVDLHVSTSLPYIIISILRFLGERRLEWMLPALKSLSLKIDHSEESPHSDAWVGELVDDIQLFLEKRYPPRAVTSSNENQDCRTLESLRLPQGVSDFLKQRVVSTSLNLERLLGFT
ncbi:hypothetical protein FRC04_012131 [Tulasnella sp. 424]|nr:hypothetical protein FRC04_012131 [Tulasnella sp. 424]KAG8971061.1 hypothetical protein FRC05_011527 [Tulasnella sp. 425]